jgi:hypothetical protein
MTNSNQRLILIVGSIVIIAAGAILILSAMPGGSPSAAAPKTTAPTAPQASAPQAGAPQAAAPATAPTEEAYPDIVRVSLGNAKAAYDLKQATFVDVRDADSYGNSHIPGAKSIPLAELETRFSELDPDAWIITYCT